jgi:hypothetical protein
VVQAIGANSKRTPRLGARSGSRGQLAFDSLRAKAGVPADPRVFESCKLALHDLRVDRAKDIEVLWPVTAPRQVEKRPFGALDRRALFTAGGAATLSLLLDGVV